jgi:gp16 family phage-associated protein
MKRQAQGDQAAVLTPAQVREAFKQHGISMSRWAEKHAFDPSLVRDVLSGRVKGDYGKAHEIAVALRLKAPPGEPPAFLAQAKQPRAA